MEEIVRCKDCKHQHEYRTGSCPYYTTYGSVPPDDWFCADGAEDEGQMKRPKETFWDSLSEVDLMEPTRHFKD